MKIDLNKYLGLWNEIARIENDFEPKMTNVTAEYRLNKDGSIQIINSGYLDGQFKHIKIINSGYLDGQFKHIKGIGITTDRDDLLKVSFFSGSYSDYKILAITDDYEYALVGGDSKDFLWMLARTKHIDIDVYNRFVKIAINHGYNTNKLILTE